MHYASELERIDGIFNQSNEELQQIALIFESVTVHNPIETHGESKIMDLVTQKLAERNFMVDQSKVGKLFGNWATFREELQGFGRYLNYDLSQSHPNLAKNLSDDNMDLFNGHSPVKFNGEYYDTTAMAQYNFHMATPKNKQPGGNCYTFNMDGALHQKRPNVNGGLSILFDKDRSRITDCFETFPVQGMGGFCGTYLFSIHAPGTLPTIAPGELHLIHKSSSYSYEYEERYNMKAPYGNCKDEHPQEMLDEYEIIRPYKHSIKTCFAYKYSNDLPISSSSSGFESHMDHIRTVQCHPECHQQLYKTTIDSLEQVEFGDDIFQIQVYNKNLETKSVTQMVAVTFEQIVANAGGLIGLWLGASMLTVLEILELLVNLCHFSLKWLWTKKIKDGSVIQPIC